MIKRSSGDELTGRVDRTSSQPHGLEISNSIVISYLVVKAHSYNKFLKYIVLIFFFSVAYEHMYSKLV